MDWWNQLPKSLGKCATELRDMQLVSEDSADVMLRDRVQDSDGSLQQTVIDGIT